MNATTANKVEAAPVHLMFIGLRTSRGDAPLGAWIVLKAEEVEQKQLLSAATAHETEVYSYAMYKKLRWCEPGAVYAVDKTDTGISYKTKDVPKFTIHAPDVAQLQAQHSAVEKDYLATVRLERNAKTRLDHKALDPIRRAYAESRGGARAQLIADVVAYITKGGD